MNYTFSVRGKNIIKIIKAVDLLGSPGGATIRGLQLNLGLSRRSVYRLLDTLQELRFPITEYESPDREKRWGLEERYLRRLPNISFPDVSLDGREAVLLQLLLAKDKLWSDTEIAPVLDSIREKLAGFLPGRKGDESWTGSVVVAGIDPKKDYRGKETVIEDLLRAVRERRVCTVTYHSFSAGTVKKYPIHPLGLLDHRGGIYLFARVSDYEDVRLFAVERIQSLEVTAEVFTVPDGFDPEKLLDGALDLNLGEPVKAKIQVSPGQAPYIRERRWAQDQSIAEQPDGSIVLTLTTSGTWDLKRWVLSMGAEARLLEPGLLAEEIGKEIERMRKEYSGPSSAPSTIAEHQK